MKIFKFITFLSLVVVLSSAEVGYSKEAKIFKPGLYNITGIHSVLGSYTGWLQVSSNGEVFKKIVLPITSPQVREKYFIGTDIQSFEQLWNGKATGDSLKFRVRTSNVLTRVNNYSLAKDDFNFNELEFKELQPINVPNDGIYTENYSYIASNLSENLFSPDERLKLDAKGETGSFLTSIAQKIILNKVIEKYRDLDFFNPYRETTEFKNNQIFSIKDMTDFDFYRNEKSILRIRNKTLTPLSVAEAAQKRAAFAYSLFEKEKFKLIETKSLHNEFGIFEEGILNSQGQVVQLRPQGDTALWFGVYIWALFVRDEILNSPESKDDLIKSIESLNHLLEISNDKTKIARYIHKSPASEPSTNPEVIQGTGIYSDYKYDSRTNKDMVNGILMGFTIAHKAISKLDSQLKARIRKNVNQLPLVSAINGSSINLAYAKGLKALWNENPEELKSYLQDIDSFTMILRKNLKIDVGFHIGGIANPSGTHLNLISNSTGFYLADELIKKVDELRGGMYIPVPDGEDGFYKFENPTPALLKIRQYMNNNLVDLSLRMQKTYLNYMPVVAYGITKDPRLKNLASQRIYFLSEVPISKSKNDLYGQLDLQPDWMYSSWPFQPWKAITSSLSVDKEKLSEKSQKRGIYSYPLYECTALSSSYMWVEGGNDFPCSANSQLKTFSVDYLWAYWLARSADLIKERD